MTSIAEKIETLPKQKTPHPSYLGPENKNTIFLSPTVPEEVEDLVSSMKKTKQVVQIVYQPISWNYIQERIFKTLKSTEATCDWDKKKCFRLKDMLNINVLRNV